MKNFLEKLAVSNFENNIFENKADIAIGKIVIVTQLFFETLCSKMPHSYQNFCKYGYSKIIICILYLSFSFWPIP